VDNSMHKALLLLVFVGIVFGAPPHFRVKHVNESAKAISLAEHDPVDPDYSKVGESAWALYKQCDARWASHRLGTCSLTLCQAGCAMSDVAMLLTTRGVNLNPDQLNSWLLGHGGYVSGCDIVWSKVDAFGKTAFQGVETANEASICSGLSAGHGIIANVNGGEHWVLLTGCKGGGVFTVNDPGFNRATYTMAEILREADYLDITSAIVPWIRNLRSRLFRPHSVLIPRASLGRTKHTLIRSPRLLPIDGSERLYCS